MQTVGDVIRTQAYAPINPNVSEMTIVRDVASAMMSESASRRDNAMVSSTVLMGKRAPMEPVPRAVLASSAQEISGVMRKFTNVGTRSIVAEMWTASAPEFV